MRQKLIQSYQPDPAGPTYGRVVQPDDLMDMQGYVKRRVDLLLRDFVMRTSAAPVVEGFSRVLSGGMVLTLAAGHATDLNGYSYETFPAGDETDVQIAAAPPANARIDLVYASLVADQDAEPLLLLHRRLLTAAEYEQNVPVYDPAEINVNTERRNAAVIGVRAGEVSANPVAPAVGVNEVPLYHVRVDAGDEALEAGKVTDVRNRLRSLSQLAAEVVALAGNLNESIDDRVAALLGNTASVVKFYDDAAGVLTLSVPHAFIADTVSAILSAQPDAGIEFTYDDVDHILTARGITATAAVRGLMAAGDKAKLDASTSAATANALAQRDGNGDASFRRVTSTVATGTSPLVVASQTEVANLNANFVQGQNLAALDARFINATGDDSMAGKLTGYNGLALAGFGLPAIVARYVNGNHAASIASTQLVAGAGDYLILVMTYTTAANGSVAVSLHFTDPSANVYNPQVTNQGLAGGVMAQASMFTTTSAAGVNFSTNYVGPGAYGIRIVVLRFN
ncbi:MAG TPA: hypothetical protein VIP46_22085 [Pyrinomonadaceae bacterium]